MAAKPSEENILNSYSLPEMLNLIRKKVQMETENRLHVINEHLHGLTGIARLESHEAEEKPSRARPRKARTPASPKEGRGKGGKLSMSQHLEQVLGNQPMSSDEILQALYANGYKSQSKDPRRVLYLELRKQVEKKKVKRMGRGKYKKI